MREMRAVPSDGFLSSIDVIENQWRIFFETD